MTVSPRARGRVPLDQRSVVQTTAGLPWWGTLACAVVAILVGFAVDSSRGDVLTMFFTVMYFIGCVLAVLMVRNKSLFTAMAQPPLLLVIAVPLAYKSFAAGPSSGLRSLVFDMGLPLVDRFPTMIVTTAVVWAIGALRIALYVRERRGAPGRQRKATAATRPAPAPRRRAAAAATADTTRRADADADAGRRTSRHRNAPSVNGTAPGAGAPTPTGNGTRRNGRRTAGEAARMAPPSQSGKRRASNHRTPVDAGLSADLAASSAAPMRGERTATAPGPADDSRSRRRAAGVPPPPPTGERMRPTPGEPVRKLPNVRYRGD